MIHANYIISWQEKDMKESDYDIEKYWDNAIVIYANYQNGDLIAFSYPEVQSRYLVWCISGHGKIQVNHKDYIMRPGKMLFLPWNHSITYLADPRNPFRLGCIHIIPDLKSCSDEKIFYNPFHKAEPLQKQYYQRHNEKLPGLEDTFEADLPLNHPIFNLCNYIIDRFSVGCPEVMLRLFPRQLLYELFRLRSFSGKINPDDAMPENMKHLLNICTRRIEEELSIQLLRLNTHWSDSTIYRMFIKYTGMSPSQFIMTLRLDHATTMLTLSNLSIKEIASRLKFRDQFHFSKSFKRRFGCSPSQYRQSGRNATPEFPSLPLEDLGDIILPRKWLYGVSERMLENDEK